ncbi:zonular occludens toxin domain-containing protein [Botrimarina mediterranea]|uniref:zonular occludens toxin domain-containing protein n=1 Tax=Botrimarina mediterranea TaxID=2528022 RepID=UPI00118B54C1|nr:Zonular occludens toxin (Zot) [Planctomycetes bacterium K2D]
MPTLLERGFSISTLTGTGGEGKSYITVHDLALNRLVRFNFHLLTNLPLRVEKLAEFVAQQRGCTPEQVAERIHLIPAETLARWEEGEGGPWEYFEQFKEHRYDLIIDEAHRFCPVGKVDKQWQAFLGEARHPPYLLQRVQFLTQSVTKIAKPIDVHAKVRYRLEKGDTRRGFLGIQLGDLYQLIASATGTLTPLVYRIEETKDAEEKWHKNNEDVFTFRKEVFELYDTHSDAGGSSTANEHKPEPEEFERRPRLVPTRLDYNGDGVPVLTAPTWAWFISRNLLAFGKVAAIFVFLIVISNGGLGLVIGQVAGTLSGFIQSTIGSVTGTKFNDPQPANTLPQAALAAIEAPGADCGCPAKSALIAELATRVRRDREALRGLGAVVALAPDFVSFRGGVTARVGDRLTSGPFAGNVIHEIDFAGRRVRISDGSWVRLAMGTPEGEDTDQVDALAEVRDLLSRADAAGGAESEEAGGERSILKPGDGGAAVNGSSLDALPADGA